LRRLINEKIESGDINKEKKKKGQSTHPAKKYNSGAPRFVKIVFQKKMSRQHFIHSSFFFKWNERRVIYLSKYCSSCCGCGLKKVIL
jgi:hypothetical protein